MTPSDSRAAGAAGPETAPGSSRLRWLLLFVSVALLSLLLASGALAIHILDAMHAQQQLVTHALAARTQMLSGLLLSIQSYNQAVGQLVAQEEADRDQASAPAPRSAHRRNRFRIEELPKRPRPHRKSAVRRNAGRFHPTANPLHSRPGRQSRRAPAAGSRLDLGPHGAASRTDPELLRKAAGRGMESGSSRPIGLW
jgi:hypothetical protein